MTMQVTIGRIVHVRIGGEDAEPVLRPALVVRVWGDTCVNLQVFLDGTNDQHVGPLGGEVARVPALGIAWCTSVTQGDKLGEWRWPAR